MAGIRLEWAQFGDFDSFDVIRSDAPMDINALPSPIATNLPTMYHVDTTVVEGATYYYRVVAWRDAASKVSGEIKVKASTGDEYWSNVVSLLHFDGNLTDEKGTVWSSGGSSFVFDDDINRTVVEISNGYVSTNTSFDIGTGDATIELFVKRFTTSQSLVYFSGGYRLNIGFDSGSVAKVYIDEELRFRYLTSPDSVENNKWLHIAVVRKDGALYLYLNGVYQGHHNTATTLTGDGGHRIGGKFNNQYPFSGRVRDFRITKGVARYTENFTPPDTPFPSY